MPEPRFLQIHTLSPYTAAPPEPRRQRVGKTTALRRHVAHPGLFPMPQAALARRRRSALAKRH